MSNAVKRTRTTGRKIARKKLDVPSCLQDHPAHARSCDIYKKEKEILEVKEKRNVSFLEARKIVVAYLRESSYASFARRANTTNEDNKYRTFMEKLIRLEANNWPKF